MRKLVDYTVYECTLDLLSLPSVGLSKLWIINDLHARSRTRIRTHALCFVLVNCGLSLICTDAHAHTHARMPSVWS